jgi:hypothetical protein
MNHLTVQTTEGVIVGKYGVQVVVGAQRALQYEALEEYHEWLGEILQLCLLQGQGWFPTFAFGMMCGVEKLISRLYFQLFFR